MFQTVQLCKRQLQNIKHGEHLSTQQPQDTQEKYVYDVVDLGDALHDAIGSLSKDDGNGKDNARKQ